MDSKQSFLLPISTCIAHLILGNKKWLREFMFLLTLETFSGSDILTRVKNITEEIVFCSSAKIERDLLKIHHLTEFEDSVIVTRSECNRCKINCPETPHYIPPTKETIPPIRYRTLSF